MNISETLQKHNNKSVQPEINGCTQHYKYHTHSVGMKRYGCMEITYSVSSHRWDDSISDHANKIVE